MRRTSRIRRFLSGSLGIAVLVLVAAIAPAAASASFDDLPGETLGDTPYTSAAVFDQTTPIFDSSGFTVHQTEINAPGVYLACGGWGAKDAWVRFATAVTGNLVVDANKSTGGGDILYKAYVAPSANPSFADLTEIGCSDAFDGPEEIYTFGHEVPANRFVFVQVLVECRPDAPCDKAERDGAPGGLTNIRIRFTPRNGDSDAVPDTLDGCPTTPGTFRGCPDADGDAVGDADDRCPSTFGRAADGCRRPDEDGDGFAALAAGGKDCNDNDAKVSPKAHDKPRNRIDENCDGHDSAYPRVKNEIERVFAYSSSEERTVGFLEPLKVAGPLVKGMAVRLYCDGRGCPFSRQAVGVPKAQRGGLVIGEGLVRRRLAPGTSVTLVVTRPGYIGEAVRFTTRHKGKMKIESLCVPVGGTTPKRTCK